MHGLLIALSFITYVHQESKSALYEIEGEITYGSSLFLDSESIPRDPVGGFPIEYSATLQLDEDWRWTFQFDSFDLEGSASNTFVFVSGFDDLDAPVIETPDYITIDQEAFAGFGTEFILRVDLNEGSGFWRWKEHCYFCNSDYLLPAAEATITSIRFVPEPATTSMAMLLLLGVTITHRSFRKYCTSTP